MNIEKFSYDNKMPRLFAMACVFWGAVGMLLGVIAAFQLAFPVLNFSEYLLELSYLDENIASTGFLGFLIFSTVIELPSSDNAKLHIPFSLFIILSHYNKSGWLFTPTAIMLSSCSFFVFYLKSYSHISSSFLDIHCPT